MKNIIDTIEHRRADLHVYRGEINYLATELGYYRSLIDESGDDFCLDMTCRNTLLKSVDDVIAKVALEDGAAPDHCEIYAVSLMKRDFLLALIVLSGCVNCLARPDRISARSHI